MANHRESWALENRSPKVLDISEEDREEQSTRSRDSSQTSVPRPKKEMSERDKFISGLGNDDQTDEEERENTMTDGNSEKEILVVASKLKNYIRAKSGMNTSGAVVDVLSDKMRELCDQAIEAAKRDGRKTVMDRDFG